jgi:hypothetical protein
MAVVKQMEAQGEAQKVLCQGVVQVAQVDMGTTAMGEVVAQGDIQEAVVLAVMPVLAVVVVEQVDRQAVAVVLEEVVPHVVLMPLVLVEVLEF